MESRHPEMLGSVLPLSDHLGKYRVGGHKRLTDLPLNMYHVIKSVDRLTVGNKKETVIKHAADRICFVST